MEATVFLVLFLTIRWIKKHSVADAAIDVFLPVFLLIPGFYEFRAPHLPSLSFADCALIPITATLVFRHWREWKFRRADLWVTLFFLGSACTELLNSDVGTAGLLFCKTITEGFMPYILGRLLLDQENVRERFLRRFAYIVFFVAVVSVWEFRMGKNLFLTLEGMVLGAHSFAFLVRDGHVRVVGPFVDSIMAGTMFATACIFSIWLAVVQKSRGEERKFLGIKRSTILTIGLAGGIMMANSRGPMLGAALAFIITRIGLSKNVGRAAVVYLSLLTVVGTAGYIRTVQYTQGSIYDAKDRAQEDAIYRRVLLDEYKPYVAAGGLFGYGVVNRPVVPGMFSIDNAYLNIELVQGKLGLWTFVLVGGESILACALAARRSRQRNDLAFALCLAGVIAGIMATITTVWLGYPIYPLFFMLAGWSQSLRQTETVAATVVAPANARFAFRRVIA